MRIVIKTAIPTWSQAHRWGDLTFAMGLRKALRRLEHEVDIEVRADWLSGKDKLADQVIHLIGVAHDTCRRGPRHIAWVISHPDRLTQKSLRHFDSVHVASKTLTQSFSEALNSVHYLPQATDTAHFSKVSSLESISNEENVLFVGNSRNFLRPILRDLDFDRFDVRVYGAQWDSFIPARLICGRWVPHELLPRLYRTSSLVLNDHWDSMRSTGMINNRIFDVLASGRVVVSDHHPALEEMMGNLVPMYKTPEDLDAQVGRFLSDPILRDELAKRGQQYVLNHHDFSHRVDALLS